MTIGRRLSISFLAILILFGINLAIYFYVNFQKIAAVLVLKNAVTSQNLAASIRQQLGDRQKHIGLLSNLEVDEGGSGAGAEEISKFNDQLEEISRATEELLQLSDPEARVKVAEFRDVYEKLKTSWKIYFENFGKREKHIKAITELAVTGEPLSLQAGEQLVQLQADEKRRVEKANSDFDAASRLADRVTVLTFIVSTFLAVAVAYFVPRHFAKGLTVLKEGAEAIGQGKLDHRIVLGSRDELGDLANTFNDMSQKLLSARMQLEEANRQLEQRHHEVEKQRLVSDSLLRNILPEEVARELQAKGEVAPKYYEDVTIMFTDFVGFTTSTEQLAAEDLVGRLHKYFTMFDRIIARYGLEKCKTIGDSYMCVGGLPVRKPSHPVDTVLAAFELVSAVHELSLEESSSPWSVRIGIHTGPVVAGVVGIQKFAFDIWGESVNFSSRMESSGAPNRINLSGQTYARVKDFFACEHRGKVPTKDQREFDMYFASGVHPQLMDGNGGQTPPPAFQRRYHIYFQSDPPAFPGFLVERREARDTEIAQKLIGRSSS